jgi:hypothetical protein
MARTYWPSSKVPMQIVHSTYFMQDSEMGLSAMSTWWYYPECK